MKNMLALSQERFSARKFTSEAVSQEDLDYIMECVRMAPSAVNKQPWKWLIVRSDEAKQKLQECYDREWFRSAPMYIVGMRNVEENWLENTTERLMETSMWLSLPNISAWLPPKEDWALAGSAIITPTR